MLHMLLVVAAAFAAPRLAAQETRARGVSAMTVRRFAPLIALLLSVAPATAQSLAFTDVTVIDVVEGAAVPGQTVIVTGDRIATVGETSEVAVPAGATVVEGSGKFLIPGLWDMHVHMVNDVAEPVPWDFHTPGPEVDDPRDIYMPIYLAYGIIGVREMSGGLASIEQRERVERGQMLGPHIVIGSPLLDGPQPVFPDAPVMPIDGPERAREVVTELHAQGFDFLKPYNLLSAESYRALHERARELGMEVAGEIPISVSVREAAELGQRTVEHLTGIEFACSSREEQLRAGYLDRIRVLNADPSSEDPVDIWVRSEWEPLASLDPARCAALHRHLAAHDTWVVPTLIIQRMISYADDPGLANDPKLRYLDPWSRELKATADYFDPERRLRALYDYRASVIDELHDAGVGILAGSDTPGGFRLHQELELFVASGLSPLDALRTATINPARYLGREDDLGSIAPGKIADLVLLSANPLEDIRNTQQIEAVVFQGQVLERARLDRMLEQLATDAENWPSSDVPRTPTFPGVPDLWLEVARPGEVGLSDPALQGLADEVASWVAAGDLMGAELLVVKDGTAALHETVGWSDRDRDLPLRRNSIFRIRSMTKPLLGTAVLMLLEEGKLSLDDPVAEYLPSFDNERSRSITIRQLLTHTSGLGNHGEEDIGLPRRGDEYETLRELVDDIGELGPARTPGEFHYSDSGSATLGALVAEISGMPVERFIERRILDPLGMADTHTRFTPDVPWAGRMNSTYRWSRESCGFERYWEPSMDQRFQYFRASGGVYSTTADYARFVTMWMNGGQVGNVRLLSRETVEAALRPVVRRGSGQEYAMHWTIQNAETANRMPLVFGHGGSDGTMALAFPAIDAVVLYFTQSRYHDERTRFRSYLAGVPPFADFMTAEGKPEIERQWSAIRSGDGGRPRTSPGQLTRYVGSYSGPVEHEVLLRGGALIIRLRDAAVPLHPVSPHVFLGHDDCADRLFRITFTQAEDGTISRYRLEFADGLTGDFERKR